MSITPGRAVEGDGFAGLRSADLRLARLGYRLAAANGPLCARQAPLTGLVIHSLQQYLPEARPAAARAFGFARPLAVEAVVPGSPADAAGVRADDQLVALNEVPLDAPSPDGKATTALRDAVERRLLDLPAGAPVRLTIERGGVARDVTIMPVAGCRVRYEMVDGAALSTDDEIIQVGEKALARFDDEAVSARLAHELGHVALRSAARREAAGATNGLFAELGASGRLNRQLEEEADRISVYILYNAGLDPAGPGRFWRGGGRKLDPGLFRSLNYPSWRERAARLDAEAARIAPGAPRPVVPNFAAIGRQGMK